METSSTRILKIMPRYLNKIVRSWIRLLDKTSMLYTSTEHFQKYHKYILEKKNIYVNVKTLFFKTICVKGKAVHSETPLKNVRKFFSIFFSISRALTER